MNMEAFNNSFWKNTSLTDLEKKIIQYWKDNNVIDEVMEKNKGKSEVKFLDGPPFKNGYMHHGHILVSTIKDTMTRFFTMNDCYVDRRNGFDVHGVPIEMLAKKIIGYNTKEELIAYGIENHNNLCRRLLSDCGEQWYKDFERIGRWIDRKREYQTMDPTFMESVIWVFNELYTKKMIFEGFKVMPYSTGCGTALSHFEAKQNYKTVVETSVICCFEIICTKYSIYKNSTDYKTYILAWTTTPWTLPMNSAICTGINMIMVNLFDHKTNSCVIMSKNMYETNYSKIMFEKKLRFNLKSQLISEDLVNIEYKPPFDFFWKEGCQNHLPLTERAFRVISDAFVKSSGQDAGTGFVHCSPSHGEEDFRVCCENNIIDAKNSKNNLIDIIDDNGCFTKDVPKYAGLYIKVVDKLIVAELKSSNLLFDSKPYTHSYPFCYRTDTPLIYKTVNAWFLNTSDEEFKQKMLENAKKINWMPENVGMVDYYNWVKNSIDWCISRTRYWGTPIPIWKSADGDEIICINSISQLEELSGIKGINDLHIEVIDKIQIPSKEGRGGMLKRVDGVLDCWFESGSMIYGQDHFPFEGQGLVDLSRNALSDFVVESKDQYRCWFYTLNVLSTALFDKPAFANAIVTGIVNGSDGQKMSKSKGNYSDPNILMDKYGADILRLYLLSTPVTKAESIKFNEDALFKLQQNSTVKIYNIGLFLVEKINLYNLEHPKNIIIFPLLIDLAGMKNVLDRWIIGKTYFFCRDLSKDFKSFQISGVASKILTYIEQLTNWYVKMARERLKGSASKFNIDDDTWKQSIETLLFVIYQFTRIVAPVLPFVCEIVYQMLIPFIKAPMKSIHFEQYPTLYEFVFDFGLEKKFNIVQKIIALIRDLRITLKLNNRRPINCAEIGCINLEDWLIIQDVLDYVFTESNILSIKKLEVSDLIYDKVEPIISALSGYLKRIDKIKDMKVLSQFIRNMSTEQIQSFKNTGLVIEPTTFTMLTDRHIGFKYLLVNPNATTKFSNGIIVKVDISYTDEVKIEHLNRLINTAIQMHRKQILLKPWQTIYIKYYCDGDLMDFINENTRKFICKNLNSMQLVEETELFDNLTKHQILNDTLLISSTMVNL